MANIFFGKINNIQLKDKIIQEVHMLYFVTEIKRY